MDLEIVPAYSYKEEINTLFTEYTNMLSEKEPSFQKYLEIQHYNEELEDLEMKYGLPDGRLYLAYYQKKLAGCIGLRRLDYKNCEMKRLYVRPNFRGKQIGSQLVHQVITDAKGIGYTYMLLDTLPFLKSAVRIYQEVGFYEIPCYNESPSDATIFMRLDL